ncbi:MAG: hypothetical protein EA365_15330 [Gloeocapsa sp. DLM2.Bin57]|nr:MAG: hypothetical protein EA365_15330 [Gloeocapsa sp. DLM2.Bin57]
MIKKLIGKKQANNGKVKKTKDGFSLQLEEEESTPDSSSVTEQSATEVTAETTTPVATSDTPDWVQLLYKQSNQETSTASPEENGTFADKYLLTMSSPTRRRPGKSMSKYMDMASQMKTPSVKG